MFEYVQVYDLASLPSALAILGSRNSYGKVVVRVDNSVPKAKL